MITYLNKQFVPVELLSLDTFASTSKEVSPFDNLYKWLAGQFGGKTKNKKIVPSAILMTPDDMKKLEIIVTKWISKFHGGAYLARERYKWHNLQFGPREFHDTPPTWAKSGFAYVCVEELFVD